MQHCCGHMLQQSVFINLLNNLFFPHYLNTCKRVCWVTDWAQAVSKANRDFQWGTDGDEQQPERRRGRQRARGDGSYFPPAAPHMEMSTERGKNRKEKKKKSKGEGGGEGTKCLCWGWSMQNWWLVYYAWQDGADIERRCKKREERAGCDLNAIMLSQISLFWGGFHRGKDPGEVMVNDAFTQPYGDSETH